MRDTFGVIGAVLLAMWVVLHLAGCGPSREAQAIAADAAYAADHMQCVAKHETNAEIDACRERVRERWAIGTTARDAGKDNGQ